MRVPTYEQQAQYQPRQIQKFQVADNTPDMRLHITADMLGGAQAKELGQAGQNLQRAGALGLRAYAEWQDTKAQAAFNAKAAEDAEALYGENGIFNLKGEAAVDAPAKLQKYMAESSKKYATQAGDAGWGQGYFQERVDRQLQQLMPRAMQHAAMEKQNFEISTRLSGAALSADEALKNAANPELFSVYHAEGLMNITLAGRARGRSDEEIEVDRRKYSSQLYMGKMQGLLTAGKIGEAQKIAGSHLLTGEDGLRAGGMIRAEQKRAEAEAKTRQNEALYNEAESLANTYWTRVDQDEITPSEALLEMRTIKDPRLRGQTMGSFTQLSQLNRMAQEEDAMKARSKAVDDFDKTGGNINAMWDIYKNANKIALSESATRADKQYAKQAKALYENMVQFNDPAIRSGSKPEAYDAVITGIADGKYTSEASLKSSEHWPYLTAMGKNTALSTLKEGQGIEMGKANKIFNEVFHQKYGREYDTKKDGGMRDQATAFVLERVKGSNRGREHGYVEDSIRLFMLDATVPNSGVIFDDTGTVGQLRSQGKTALPKVDENTRTAIERMFHANQPVQKAFMAKYGKLEYAIRGYYLENEIRKLGPRGQLGE